MRKAEALVQKLVTETSFDATGALIPEGQIGMFDPARLTGKEPHLFDVTKDRQPVVVEQSALAPTGPNPQTPQQIPPDAVQTAAGVYARPGVILKGEVTRDADQRLADRVQEGDTSEGDLQEELAELRKETAQLRAELEKERQTRETEQRSAIARVATTPSASSMLDDETAPARTASTPDDNDALVAGTVAEVTDGIDQKSDDEIAALRKAEQDREKPRAGVLKALDAEEARRKEQSKG
jgi:hypothetical protein